MFSVRENGKEGKVEGSRDGKISSPTPRLMVLVWMWINWNKDGFGKLKLKLYRNWGGVDNSTKNPPKNQRNDIIKTQEANFRAISNDYKNY